jgi:adenine-specific DNA-methyltransferase
VSNELRSLLARVEANDPATAKELSRHIDTLQSRRQFGLNFERHIPESVALPGRSISVGDKVRFLSPRGQTEAESDTTWLVTDITGPTGKRTVGLINPRTKIEASRALEDVVFVADFRDPIYPSLAPSGEPVLRGGDKPFHTVINAENYHALEAMLFTYQGRVDCIYIDPPYNTGAKDWKYNNDYVDGEDAYRHSKWLAFMERRLKVARKLLNPRDSMLIVTIDEKEVHRLALVLEQVFTEAKIQMVSVGINPAPPARNGLFGRADEFYFFVLFGEAAIRPTTLGSDWITAKGRTHRGEIRWDLLRKSGASPTREGHPDTFYAFFVTHDGKRIHSVGEPIGVGASRHEVLAPEGTFAVWPIRKDGSEGRWRLQPSTARKVMAEGGIRLGVPKGETTPVYYLSEGEREKITEGMYTVTGHREDGSAITSVMESSERRIVPGTQWKVPAHDSTQYGSRLLAKFLPGRKFPFPKSLYAVEDALRFAVADKPNALIVDFFTGSGTTTHAVMRLNRQLGGQRRSVVITNNEVSATEQAALVNRKLRPGDPQWEALGICEFITKPRIRAAVTGLTPGEEPIDGDYKFTDEFPMSDGFAENVAFFTLTYENPALVELDMAFKQISPLLWMRAGSQGRIIDQRSDAFDVADTYAVLFDVDASKLFLAAVEKSEDLGVAFIVTDDETQYQAVAGQLPDGIESVRLYESYLRTFQINTGRA